MLVILITVLASAGPTPKWHVPDLGIYRPLSRPWITAGLDGRLYIVDSSEVKIHIYGPDGQHLKTFGQKGEGPGELLHPSWPRCFKDKLYIQTARGLAVFDLDGQFLEMLKTPEAAHSLVKVLGGWAYGDWSYFMGRERPGKITWLNERLQEPGVLLDLRKPGAVEEGNSAHFNLEKAIPYNPAEDEPILVGSPDGRWLYYRHVTHNLKVSIFNMETKTSETISLNPKKIPFNTDWGKAKLKSLNEQPAQGSFKLKYSEAFPDYFPSVKDMAVLDDGLLYLQHWSGMPDKTGPVTVLNASGKEVKGAIPAEGFERVVSIIGGDAIVLTYDSEEETAGIARCSLSDVAGFIKAHPINYKPREGLILLFD